MRKKQLKFKVRDGLAPKQKNDVVNVLCPLPLNLQEGQTIKVSSGVSFSQPVMVCAARTLARYGVTLENDSTIFFAGEEVYADLTSEASAMFEVGETLLYVIPVHANYELVKE